MLIDLSVCELNHQLINDLDKILEQFYFFSHKREELLQRINLLYSQNISDKLKNNFLHYLVSAWFKLAYKSEGRLDGFMKLIDPYIDLLHVQNSQEITPFQLCFLCLVNNLECHNEDSNEKNVRIDICFIIKIIFKCLPNLDDLKSCVIKYVKSMDCKSNKYFLDIFKKMFFISLEEYKEHEDQTYNSFLEVLMIHLLQQDFIGLNNKDVSWHGEAFEIALRKGYKKTRYIKCRFLLDNNLLVNNNELDPTIILPILDDYDLTERFLQAGANPNACDYLGFFPMYQALSVDSPLEIIQLLLDYGADINQKFLPTPQNQAYKRHYGNTVLTKAMSLEMNMLIEFLISKGAKIDNFIHIAVLTKNVYMIKYALNYLGESINKLDNNGKPPIEMLLESNPIDGRSLSASDLIQQYIEVFEFLVQQQGINIDYFDQNNNGFLHKFYDKNSGNFYLSVDSFFKKISTVHNVFGNQINMQNAIGDTPLHIVAKNRSIKLFIHLVREYNADVNIMNNKNESPLMLLLKRNADHDNERLLYELIKEKINPDVIDLIDNEEGKSLLHLLAIKGYTLLSNLLIDMKANCSIKDKFGLNPAFYALAYGEIDCYFLLKPIDDVTEDMFYFVDDNYIITSLKKSGKQKYNILFPETEQEIIFTVQFCLQAISYTRWGTTAPIEQYEDCINFLITRYGEMVFIEACRKLFDEHLDNLDLVNVYEKGPHSDMAPLRREYLNCAKYLLKGHYNLHMEGHGYLVNAKTVFGDEDFWLIFKNKYTQIYQKLINIIVNDWFDDNGKPKEDRKPKGCYHNVTSFCPISVFMKHFPTAFNLVTNDLEKILRAQTKPLALAKNRYFPS